MSVSEESSSTPSSHGRARWVTAAPMYSFTPPKSTTPKRVSEESAVDFETEFPLLGTHSRTPRKRRTSTQSSSIFTSPPNDRPPTPIRLTTTPPPESFKVLSPTPNKAPVSNILGQTEPDIIPSNLFAEPEQIRNCEEETPTSIRPPGMEPQHATSRNKSPFYPEHPTIIDGQSLLAAVQENPDAIYLNICTIMHNLTEAQAQHKSVADELNSRKLDHECQRASWDRLLGVEKAKQVVMWKFADRIHRGDPEPGKGKKKQNSSGTYENENKNPQTKEAVKQALSIGANYPPFLLPVFETTSNDNGPIGSMEWRPMGLDPGAESQLISSLQQTFTPIAPISPHRIIASHPAPEYGGMSNEELHNRIGNLAPRFYGVCPISLISSLPCPMEPCNLAHLCDSYNNEDDPAGCAETLCGRVCRYVHEYRTCEFEVDKDIPCHIATPSEHARERVLEEHRRVHMGKRVHKSQCDAEEWNARQAVAGLKYMHLIGRYNAQ